MTTYIPRPHGEYLEWIDEHLENLAIILAYPRPEKLSIWDYFNASLLANRAVLERHKPEEVDGQVFCFACESDTEYDNQHLFPCPPLLDVTNQLDEVMG